MTLAETLYIPVADNVQLAATSFGEVGKPVVILMHGAGQTRHSWRQASQRLGDAGWHAVAIDARGHGNSDWPEDGDYSIDTLVSDLLVLARHFESPGNSKPVLVGASLGGICGLLAEGEAVNQIFRSMVLVDITPRIENTGVARIIDFMNRYQDGFASVKEAATAVASYKSRRIQAINSAVQKTDTQDAASAAALAAERGASPDGLKKNLRLADDGRYYWHWDPRLMQHIGSINKDLYQRQREAAAKLELPVLLIRGQQSDIVSTESVHEFLQLVPHARFQDIADAAHMVAGDNNDIFARSVLDFIETDHG